MDFEEFDQIAIACECRNILEQLIKKCPESLEEVLDDLHGCLLFYSENFKRKERELEQMKSIEQNLQLEIF